MAMAMSAAWRRATSCQIKHLRLLPAAVLTRPAVNAAPVCLARRQLLTSAGAGGFSGPSGGLRAATPALSGGSSAATQRVLARSSAPPQRCLPPRPEADSGGAAASAAPVGTAGAAGAGNLARLCQIRCFQVSKIFPWKRIREKIVTKTLKYMKRKRSNHKESLRRFRLTRFGWERRKAGLRARAKRHQSYARRTRAKKIAYVHRHDYWKLKKAIPLLRFRVRDLPLDHNFNIKECRQALPAHFG
eukprot:TRINITY_DN45230_c0_g1_i1.p2 TRINITY_DN45230_c0_g1~~TRINITY_DN45230_c0_g1_i1.p2  ORF type:complete len:245 (+),score=34.74 TRINITY_DN45230_c0_g1_i1:85-819(+)